MRQGGAARATLRPRPAVPHTLAPRSSPTSDAQTQLHPPVPLLAPLVPAPALHMKVPLAGADAAGHPTETLLSEVGLVLLRFFDTREACVLRLVCREFVEAVRVQQWEDRDTVIHGSIQRLSVLCCTQAMITDAAAFVHLRGVRVLNMGCCRQLKDAAFVHLQGIHTLFMTFCDQPAITDAAFAQLAGIDTLVMDYCYQPTITGAGLAHLTGVRRLAMASCAPDAVAYALDQGLPATAARVRNYEAFSCTVGGELWSA